MIMMNDCIFCKIVKGEIPCYKVFENKDVLAFLDIAPCSDGHTVIVPKKHVAHFEDMSSGETGKLFAGVNSAYKVLIRKMEISAANIGMNNHPEAGQVVDHVHIHIIPRKSDDDGGSIHSIINLEGASDYVRENSKLF